MDAPATILRPSTDMYPVEVKRWFSRSGRAKLYYKGLLKISVLPGVVVLWIQSPHKLS